MTPPSGAIVGITSGDDGGREEAARIDADPAVMVAAEKKMAGAAAPAATPLPVEPARPANDGWKETAPKRIVTLGSYQFSSSDVTFITPPLNT